MMLLNYIRSLHNNDFIDDWEKMRDFFQLTRSEFLKSYSYLHEMEYDATAKRVLREGILLKDIVTPL